MARTTNRQPHVIGAGIAAFKASLAVLKGKRISRVTDARAYALLKQRAARLWYGERFSAYGDLEVGFILIRPVGPIGGAA